MDFGILMIRVVVGLVLAAHGAQKLFGWFEGPGLDRTGKFFETLGFRPGRRHAMLAGVAETGGGALLVLGLLTPLGAAAAIGMMLAATIAVHMPNGFFAGDGGYEFPLVLGVAAAGVAFTGPGSISFDSAFGRGFGGFGFGILAVLVGSLTAAGVLSRRVDEAAEAPTAEEAEAEQEQRKAA